MGGRGGFFPFFFLNLAARAARFLLANCGAVYVSETYAIIKSQAASIRDLAVCEGEGEDGKEGDGEGRRTVDRDGAGVGGEDRDCDLDVSANGKSNPIQCDVAPHDRQKRMRTRKEGTHAWRHGLLSSFFFPIAGHAWWPSFVVACLCLGQVAKFSRMRPVTTQQPELRSFFSSELQATATISIPLCLLLKKIPLCYFWSWNPKPRSFFF